MGFFFCKSHRDICFVSSTFLEVVDWFWDALCLLICSLSSTILQGQQKELLWNHHELIMEVRFLQSFLIQQVKIWTCHTRKHCSRTWICKCLYNCLLKKFRQLFCTHIYTHYKDLMRVMAACHWYSWWRVMIWYIVNEIHKVVTTPILAC